MANADTSPTNSSPHHTALSVLGSRPAHVPTLSVLGLRAPRTCPHYQCWVHAVHPVTHVRVPCRRCYNDAALDTSAHHHHPPFDRYAVRQMVCTFCGCAQPAAAACVNPECTQHGKRHRYYCDVCHLWEHDVTKTTAHAAPDAPTHHRHRLFHCDACGLCRVGDRARAYRHCTRCQMCIPTCVHPLTNATQDAHTCVGGAAADNPCPVCYTDLASSCDAAVFLKCGHALHQQCAAEWWRLGGLAAMLGGCPVCRG